MKLEDLMNILNDTKILKRLVIYALVALLVLAGSFAGYYYWDRYVHIGDKSPLELGVQALEEAVRDNPDDPDARVALAHYYYENGAYKQAVEQAQQVLSVYPDADGAMFILGMAYIQIDDVESAVPQLEKFVEIRNQSGMAQSDNVLQTALYFLGEVYVRQHESEKAVAVLTNALMINSTDADAMYQLGLAYAQTGDYEQAVGQYQSAVRFVPDFYEAYTGMAESYAILAMPGQVLYARGMQAYSNGDYQEAVELLQQSADQSPDFAPAFLGLGLAYEQMGSLDSALEAIERVLELDPANFMASHAFGRIQAAGDS